MDDVRYKDLKLKCSAVTSQKSLYLLFALADLNEIWPFNCQ